MKKIIVTFCLMLFLLMSFVSAEDNACDRLMDEFSFVYNTEYKGILDFNHDSWVGIWDFAYMSHQMAQGSHWCEHILDIIYE